MTLLSLILKSLTFSVRFHLWIAGPSVRPRWFFTQRPQKKGKLQNSNNKQCNHHSYDTVRSSTGCGMRDSELLRKDYKEQVALTGHGAEKLGKCERYLQTLGYCEWRVQACPPEAWGPHVYHDHYECSPTQNHNILRFLFVLKLYCAVLKCEFLETVSSNVGSWAHQV